MLFGLAIWPARQIEKASLFYELALRRVEGDAAEHRGLDAVASVVRVDGAHVVGIAQALDGRAADATTIAVGQLGPRAAGGLGVVADGALVDRVLARVRDGVVERSLDTVRTHASVLQAVQVVREVGDGCTAIGG